MPTNKCISLKCFRSKYILTFLSLLILVNLSSCFGCFVTLFGQIFIVSLISWFVTKKIQQYLNNELITSYKRAVLITGCDTGFGNQLALALNDQGFRVYATVLDPEGSGAQKLLTTSRFVDKTCVLRMDVTNDEEVKSVKHHIQRELELNGEELWAVVNNAGIVMYGPLDWGSIETYKSVFDINTFGTVRVTRTFLPLIRQSKGRIVNVVSVAGRLTAANLSIYSMSKHANTAFSDALRRETHKWGIKVSTIEPTAYRTAVASDDYFQKAVDKQWAETEDSVKQVYGQEYYDTFRKTIYNIPSMSYAGDNIFDVIDKMVDAVRNPEPQFRYVVVGRGYISKLFILLLELTPYDIFEEWVKLREKKNALKPKQL